MREDIPIDLTAEQWLSLIDGESPGSQLRSCCGEISELRDLLIVAASSGRRVPGWLINDTIKAIDAVVASDHTLDHLPTLMRFIAQVRGGAELPGAVPVPSQGDVS